MLEIVGIDTGPNQRPVSATTLTRRYLAAPRARSRGRLRTRARARSARDLERLADTEVSNEREPKRRPLLEAERAGAS